MIAHGTSSEPADQLLVFDVGNSSTSLGAWHEGDIRASAMICDSEFASLAQHIAEYWQAMPGTKDAIACSVVPQRLQELKEFVREVTGEQLLVVGDSLPVPLEVKIDEPESVGMDRLCCAAAAYMLEGGACTVADLGTAVTLDCVNDAGQFIGGAILPGMTLQAAALCEWTAQLPQVVVERPSSPLGLDTTQAIQAGIFHGIVGAIRELVESYASRLGCWPALYLTGGDAPLITEALQIADKVVPHLCLRGVVLAYQKAHGACDSEP